MSGTRFRLVDTQNGNRHVSTVVLSEVEAVESLEAEATLHRLGGWTVTTGDRLIVCRKGAIERVIQVQAFDPHNDRPTEGQ